MSEEKSQYGKHLTEVGKNVDNPYKSVAEEMASSIKETIIDLKILKGNVIMESEVNQRFIGYDSMIQRWIDRNQSALEKFNKLKENE